MLVLNDEDIEHCGHTGTRWQSERLLDCVKPVYVVMYDPDAAFVRCLEVFKAMHPGRPLRVYFLTYQDSVRHTRNYAGPHSLVHLLPWAVDVGQLRRHINYFM